MTTPWFPLFLPRGKIDRTANLVDAAKRPVPWQALRGLNTMR
jgi:hypothetical protein